MPQTRPQNQGLQKQHNQSKRHACVGFWAIKVFRLRKGRERRRQVIVGGSIFTKSLRVCPAIDTFCRFL